MAKKKEMNRTSGTAKRKAPNMSQSERIGRQRQAAAANPGPRDKFNPAAAQEVVDTFGFGVGASGKFEFNPIATLGMALPFGKVAKAAKALGKAGRIVEAAALESRLKAKVLGKKNPFRAGLSAAQQDGNALKALGNRRASERVFPRYDAARSGEFRGMTSREVTAQLGRKADIPMASKRELSEAVKQTTTGFTKFSKGAVKRGR